MRRPGLDGSSSRATPLHAPHGAIRPRGSLLGPAQPPNDGALTPLGAAQRLDVVPVDAGADAQLSGRIG
jgi:hypothetical protein